MEDRIFELPPPAGDIVIVSRDFQDCCLYYKGNRSGGTRGRVAFIRIGSSKLCTQRIR